MTHRHKTSRTHYKGGEAAEGEKTGGASCMFYHHSVILSLSQGYQATRVIRAQGQRWLPKQESQNGAKRERPGYVSGLGVLLTLMVSLTQVQFPVSCPASCIVCSEDAIICNKLSSIIEAPDSTKALMLTDGLIDTVGSIVLSDSSNMSILALSNNVISTIMDNAFQNLTVLRTLILDHNRISNQALDTLTFSWLRKLETLHLGNNALRDIDGSWFQSTKALKTLLLEGNLLTSLNSSTFASSDLRNLEILDLSDNLIAYLGRNSFRNLPRLRSLDLSRNRLQNAPDAFSYLSWLSMLNLDLNRWNCTCELRELASFLNSYFQSPGKVLYNGQRMACVSSDNPAVQTVLELTDANCVPANSNITVTVVAKSSITPQRYIRDVAVTAICFFLGGVGITLGVLALVYRKLGKKFRLQEKNEAEEQSSQASAQWDFSEDKEALSMAYSLHNRNHRGSQPWNKENTSYDVKSVDNHFICPNCSSTTLGTGYQEGGQRRETLLQRANHRGLQHKREDGWSTPVESDRWKETEGHSVLQSRIKDIRAQRRDEKGNGGVNLFRLRSPETVSHGASKDTSTIRMQQASLHYNQTSEESPAREQRSVTFDLSGSLEQGLILPSKEHEGPYRISKTKTSQTRENSPKSGKISSRSPCMRSKGLKSRNLGSQLSRKLKVKLNLNPLRRNRVHSTSSHSHEDSEADGTSIKAKKGKSQKRKDDPKEKSKKPPWSGSKAVKKSKRSDSEKQDETPTVEQDSKKTPSKRTASKKNDQESSRNNQEDVLKDQSDTNYPADGEVQNNSSLMSANAANASSSESQILQNSAVPLTHSLDLSAATVQPLSMVKTTDPQQAANPDLNLPVSTLENIGGPQEEPTGSQEVGENSTTPVPTAPTVVQEYLSSGDGSPKRRIRLIIPEKTSNRPQTALERKIR
ncbi:hypothetical protein AOLI_G00212850 [Acnodon oligacanthus]